MGLRYIWRIGYDNRATCHEVRALRQGVFSNLLKPPSRLNIQVLTESPTYLPPSDRPLKDSGLAALTVQLQSPVTGAASLKPRAAAASRPPPLQTRGGSSAVSLPGLCLSAAVALPASRRSVEDLAECLPGLCSLYIPLPPYSFYHLIQSALCHYLKCYYCP